jgi:hypothetical protein
LQPIPGNRDFCYIWNVLQPCPWGNRDHQIDKEKTEEEFLCEAPAGIHTRWLVGCMNLIKKAEDVLLSSAYCLFIATEGTENH